MVSIKGNWFGPNASLGKIGYIALKADMWPHICVL